ncbi:MAG: HEAT repeat domain-containing protein [Myxococcales bacterium]|nr:HEAT repeat domain-containing protein [Myxococcales bacterium]
MKNAVPLHGLRPFFKTALALTFALSLITFSSSEALAQKRTATKQEIKQSQIGNEIKEANSRGALNTVLSRANSQGLVTNNLLMEMERCIGSGNRNERMNCLYAVSQLAEPKHANILLKRLQRLMEYDDNQEMRALACTSIGRLGAGAKPAIVDLAKATEDKAAPVRREALVALGKLKAKKQGPDILKRALLEDEVDQTRQAAILALGEVGYTAAAKELEGLLKHSSEMVRLTAAKSLCLMDLPSGRKFTEGLLKAEDEYKRRDAIVILSGLKPKWTVEAIASLLGDKELSVQIAAAKALSIQGDMRGTRWLVLAAKKAEAADDYALVNRIEQAIEDAKVPTHQRKAILSESNKPAPKGKK